MIAAKEILTSDKSPVKLKEISGRNSPKVKKAGKLFPITSSVVIIRKTTVPNSTSLKKTESIPVRMDFFRG
jgi:hypothetical protein